MGESVGKVCCRYYVPATPVTFHKPSGGTMGPRDSDGRKTYAEYRLSLAAERLILSTDPAAKQTAAKWVLVWAIIVRSQHKPR